MFLVKQEVFQPIKQPLVLIRILKEGNGIKGFESQPGNWKTILNLLRRMDLYPFQSLIEDIIDWKGSRDNVELLHCLGCSPDKPVHGKHNQVKYQGNRQVTKRASTLEIWGNLVRIFRFKFPSLNLVSFLHSCSCWALFKIKVTSYYYNEESYFDSLLIGVGFR
jgi:hypothetical protein